MIFTITANSQNLVPRKYFRLYRYKAVHKLVSQTGGLIVSTRQVVKLVYIKVLDTAAPVPKAPVYNLKPHTWRGLDKAR